MNDEILSIAIALAIAVAIGGQLQVRVKNRSGINPPLIWVVAHIGGGLLLFGAYWWLAIRDNNPLALLPNDWWGQAARLGLIIGLQCVGLFVIQKMAPVPECGCEDEDEPAPSTHVKRSTWDPFYTPPPEPWHGQTAMATIGGFLLGIAFATPDSLVQAWSNPWLTLLRQLGPLVVYGTTGALCAWGLYRGKLRRRPWLLLQAAIGAAAIALSYFATNALAFPWSLLSWLLIPSLIAVIWRYAGDSHAIRRPPRSKKRQDPPCD